MKTRFTGKEKTPCDVEENQYLIGCCIQAISEKMLTGLKLPLKAGAFKQP